MSWTREEVDTAILGFNDTAWPRQIWVAAARLMDWNQSSSQFLQQVGCFLFATSRFHAIQVARIVAKVVINILWSSLPFNTSAKLKRAFPP